MIRTSIEIIRSQASIQWRFSLSSLQHSDHITLIYTNQHSIIHTPSVGWWAAHWHQHMPISGTSKWIGAYSIKMRAIINSYARKLSIRPKYVCHMFNGPWLHKSLNSINSNFFPSSNTYSSFITLPSSRIYSCDSFGYLILCWWKRKLYRVNY